MSPPDYQTLKPKAAKRVRLSSYQAAESDSAAGRDLEDTLPSAPSSSTSQGLAVDTAVGGDRERPEEEGSPAPTQRERHWGAGSICASPAAGGAFGPAMGRRDRGGTGWETAAAGHSRSSSLGFPHNSSHFSLFKGQDWTCSEGHQPIGVVSQEDVGAERGASSKLQRTLVVQLVLQLLSHNPQALLLQPGRQVG